MSAIPSSSDSDPAIDLALVSMPFFSAEMPSIQLGLLASVAREEGFSAETHHLYLDLAAALQPPLYESLCDFGARMLGEWLFGVAAFGEAASSPEQLARHLPREADRLADTVGGAEALKTLRCRILPDYIDTCLRSINWARYSIVGFTSTFQQTVASLALARRIKAAHPRVRIVFGGANMDADAGVEYLLRFSWVDYTVRGEGERALPELLRYVREPGGCELPSGVVARIGDRVVSAPGQRTCTELDKLPVPDYSEYFDRASRLGVLAHPTYGAQMPVESSRGCWWGEKHACTFCGLNGASLRFRCKSPSRFTAELDVLARRHRITEFRATDNVVPVRYVTDFFGSLAQCRTDFRFFYEVKSNLTREQIRSLYRGGVRHVQPGIESLNTHVLQLMNKGCSVLQNVSLLKWCRYYGVHVSWNLLWGFPGETEQDYREELQVLRKLLHLEPPAAATRVWVARSSPMFREAERYEFENVTPEISTRLAYPDPVDVSRIAFFFTAENKQTLPEAAHGETRQFVAAWQQAWTAQRRPELTYRRTRDAVFLDDARDRANPVSHAWYGPLAFAYEACAEPHTATEVHDALRREMALNCSREDVAEALDGFCQSGFMLVDKGSYLSLALPANPNW